TTGVLVSRRSRVETAVVADPQPLWLLLIAALFTIADLVADVVLGLSRPEVGVPGPRSVWTLLGALPTPRRQPFIENLRLQQVYEALYQTSIDIAFEGTPIGGVRGWVQPPLLARGARAPRRR